MLLAAFWVRKLQGVLWRRAVWRAAGAEIAAWAQANGAQVLVCALGYCVRTGPLELRWAGGLRGLHTAARHGRKWVKTPGLATGVALDALIRRL